jgi:hypothetical protein
MNNHRVEDQTITWFHRELLDVVLVPVSFNFRQQRQAGVFVRRSVREMIWTKFLPLMTATDVLNAYIFWNGIEW